MAKNKQARQEAVQHVAFREAVKVGPRMLNSATDGHEGVTGMEVGSGLLHILASANSKDHHVAVPLSNVTYLNYQQAEAEQEDGAESLQARKPERQTQAPVL